jgi:hypothetical protein
VIGQRLLMGGGGSFPTPPGPSLIGPSGSRVQLSTTGYQAFPMMMLENGDDLRLLYRHGSAHNSPGATFDMMVSTDLGVTWPGSATTLITSVSPNDVRPGPVMLSSTGRYIWGFNRRNPYNGFNITAKIKYTDDDWATQSSEYEPPPYSGPLTSVIDGSIFEHAGEIILPGFAQISSGVEFCVIWRSSDDGATFAAAEIIAQDGSIDFQEPIMQVLDSGRWLCLMRSESNHHTWRTYSDDDGATWSTPDDVNEMTGTPVFLEYEPGAIIQFGRYLTSADSPGYYAISFDDGDTWTTPLEIDPGETGLWMSCGAVVSSPGVVKMVYSLEINSSTARRYFRTFA